MPTAAAAPAPSAKRYDEAFKRQAVELWIKTGKPGTQIARELGVSYPCLKDWKRRYCGDATPERDGRPRQGNPRAQSRTGPCARAAGHTKKKPGIFTGPPKGAAHASKP